jgi:hypothetical protein
MLNMKFDTVVLTVVIPNVVMLTDTVPAWDKHVCEGIRKTSYEQLTIILKVKGPEL